MMKKRMSDALAWVGFSYLALVNVFAIMGMKDLTDILIGTRRVDVEEIRITLIVYVGCAVINYVMMGSLRLLPWRYKDETPETLP